MLPVSCVQTQALQVKPEIYLWEPALFINQGHDIHGLECNDFQGLVIISEINVVPRNVLCKVFLLLQLEHMVHKELLKVLICNVNAQLLKAGKEQDESPWSSLASAALLSPVCLATALDADTPLPYSTVLVTAIPARCQS